MGDDQAKAFLEYLRDKSAEREGLHNAVVEEIVAAGAQAGYKFTAEELHDALKVHIPQNAIQSWSH